MSRATGDSWLMRVIDAYMEALGVRYKEADPQPDPEFRAAVYTRHGQTKLVVVGPDGDDPLDPVHVRAAGWEDQADGLLAGEGWKRTGKWQDVDPDRDPSPEGVRLVAFAPVEREDQ